MSLNQLLKLQAGGASKATVGTPTQPIEDSAPVEPTPAKPKGMGFPFAKSTPAPEAPVSTPAVVESSASDDPFDLANIDLGAIGTQEPDSDGSDYARELVMFADLIDATAPERTLPPEITHQQLGFVNLLDSIYDILQDSDLFAQAVRTIMSELQTNVEYIQLVSDRDVHVLIRGMRQTMGLARVRKAEKATKRKPAASKKQTFDLGIDLGSLGL
jgi:hypothetical protein